MTVTFFTHAGAQDLNSLAEKLRSGNTEQKRDVLMQLRSVRSEAASRVAAVALNDNEPIVRATAASSVTFLPRGEAAAALLPLLRDKDEFVRREGAYAVGEVGEPSTADQLVELLRGDKSSEVRTAAAVALGKVGSPGSVSQLLDVLKQKPNEDNEMLRRAAARSIGQIAQIMRSGKVRVVTPQNFLPDEYKDVGPRPSPGLLSHFQGAVTALSRILDSDAESDDTRREAAFALGSIGDPAAVPVLSKYLSSPDAYLAEIVKEALMKLKASE